MKNLNYKIWQGRQMKNPAYRKAYDSLKVEFSIIEDIIRKRIEKDMSQADLARKIGSHQATISKLESGTYNPSLKFLKRLANALNSKLSVRLA